MLQPPRVYLIHADDAPQHQGRLQQILQQLQAEQRIANFHTLRHDAINTLKDQVQNHDLVIVLLTHDLTSIINSLEQSIKDLRVEQPEVKTAEVVVDNLPYHNDFITFPADLKPIRSRDDMDAVWQEIKFKLQQMLPVQPDPLPTPSPSSSISVISFATKANIIFLTTILIAMLTLKWAQYSGGIALIAVLIIHAIGLVIVFRSAQASIMTKIIIIATLVIALWRLFDKLYYDYSYNNGLIYGDYFYDHNDILSSLLIINFINFAGLFANSIVLFFRKRKKTNVV